MTRICAPVPRAKVIHGRPYHLESHPYLKKAKEKEDWASLYQKSPDELQATQSCFALVGKYFSSS